MNFTSGYFKGAQEIIMGVLKDVRPELMRVRGKIEHELKDDLSIVTHLDKELEIKLKDALRKFDPSVGFLGEEHGKEGNENSYWLVDPIDGTESFTRGLSSSRNILTFVDNNEAQFALAYRFPTDDLFLAEKDKGTTKNGTKVELSNRTLKRAWLEFDVKMLRPNGYKVYQLLRPHIAGVTMHHDFLEVLEGSMEGLIVYKSRGQIWDYAPRALFIKEAGGRVANLGSEAYDIHNLDLIATTPQIFDEVAVLLKDIA